MKGAISLKERTRTVKYTLRKDGIDYSFDAQKDAAAFLRVSPGALGACYSNGCRCKGYEIIRGDADVYATPERKTRLYKIWRKLRSRHGAGDLCYEWLDYVKFKDWAIKSGYSDDLEIHRYDSSIPYNPENCKWITINERGRLLGRLGTKPITYMDRTYSLSEWSRLTGIHVKTLQNRYYRGWGIHDMLTVPARRGRTSAGRRSYWYYPDNTSNVVACAFCSGYAPREMLDGETMVEVCPICKSAMDVTIIYEGRIFNELGVSNC